MTYHFRLDFVAIIIGFSYTLFSLFSFFYHQKTYNFLKQFSRSFFWGVFLTLIASIWALALILFTDIGEFTPMRSLFVFFMILATLLTIFFVRDFLAIRALAILKLLGANILLDAAFTEPSPSSLLITILAYLWIVSSLILIFYPFLLRDLLNKQLKSLSIFRTTLSCIGILGITLLCFGVILY